MKTIFVSLGSNCYISMTLRKTGFQRESYPFDWINTFGFKEELEFIKDLYKSTDILKDIPISNLEVDLKNNIKSYYLEKYKVRMPHEHDIKKDMTNEEIIEKYERRYKRLIEHCKAADHVIFIRTIAYKCYELKGEINSDYSREIIEKFVEFLKVLCCHDNFTIMIVSNDDSLKNMELKNTVIVNSIIPFENTEFVADKSLPTGDEARKIFQAAFEKLSGTNSLTEVKKSIIYPFNI